MARRAPQLIARKPYRIEGAGLLSPAVSVRVREDEDAVHYDLLLLRGILNLEFMIFDTLLADDVDEFLFVFTPLRLKGATGSPGRPLAIR